MARGLFSVDRPHRRRPLFAVLAAVLCAGVLSATAASPAAADDSGEAAKPPASKANKNHGKGGASAVGVAVAKARKAKKRVEIPTERTTTDTVYANPDGSVTRERATAPIRAKGAEGKLATIDTDLAKQGKRLAPKVATGKVSFTSDGSGSLVDYAPGKKLGLGLGFDGDLAAPKVEDATASYPITDTDGAVLRASAGPDGFAADVILTKPPAGTTAPKPSEDESPPETPASPAPSASSSPDGSAQDDTADAPTSEAAAEGPVFRFSLDLAGLSASLKNHVLLLSDAKGEVVAQSRRLQMWDARRDSAGDPNHMVDVDAKLTKGGTVLELRPSAKFLADPETEYPVTVDPELGPTDDKYDTYYFSSQSNSDFRGSDYRLLAGYYSGNKFRSLMTFDDNAFLGKDVTNASLRLRQYSSNQAALCTPEPMNVYPETSNGQAGTVWSNQPSVTTDARFKSSKSFNHGQGACPDAFESIDVTQAVNAWAGGVVDSGGGRQGLVLRAPNETSAAQHKRFCSRNPSANPDLAYCGSSAYVPTLSVTYTPQLGVQSWYSMTNHSLNDRSSLAVNNDNGDLVVQAGDVDVNGVGLDLKVNRVYNSQAQTVSSLGQGWGLNVGSDVFLEKKSAYRYDYHGPGGTVLGSFIRKSSDDSDSDYDDFFTPIGGVDADLEQDGNEFTLTFHSSQAKFVFTTGVGAGDDAYQSKSMDRSDNTITINYASSTTSNGAPKMTSITDTAGRDFPITYTGDHVTKIENSAAGGRDWTYGYSGDYLTSYTDPSSATTNYDYTSATSGPDLLTKITDPTGGDGRPTTEITYDYNGSIDVNEVQEVSYRYGNAAEDTYDYTWDYNTTIVADCDDHGDHSTVVTDPNAHDTTYCYQQRDDADGNAKTWVYDALGHARSTEYTADNAPSNITSPTAQNVAGGSTVATYSDNIPDQLSKVTEPKGDGAQAATTGLEYDHANSPSGGDYLPSSVKGTGNDCNRFGYDDDGRTTDAYTGISATSSSSCGSSSGGDHAHREYNDDGTVDESWDADATDDGSDPSSDADKTIYTYWDSGDAGFVNGTKGQVKTIRSPGGDCSTGSGRRLCTSYTYDDAARVKTQTDGAGKTTTYSYDVLDRTKQAYVGNALECAPLLVADCVQYSYDAEGNLVQRVDRAGIAHFAHDRLNRLTAQTIPVNLLANDQINYAYDGTSSLTAYQQIVSGTSDIVLYAYDAADRLDYLIDATGTTDVSVNDDGRTTGVDYPHPAGTNGLSIDYDFTGAGQPESMDIHAGPGNFSFDYDYTTTIAGTDVDTTKLQSKDVSGTSSSLDGTTSYDYDSGHLASASDSNGPDHDFTYDRVGNLRSRKAGSQTTYYGYDRAGELCWQGDNDDQGAALARTCAQAPSGDETVNHDPAGNSLGTAADPVAYNDLDQATTIDGKTQKYTDQGNDLRTDVGGNHTVTGQLGITTIKNGGGQIIYYTRDPAGTILSSHTSDGSVVSHYASDPYGNVTLYTDQAGNTAGAYEYAPYGQADLIGYFASLNPFRWIGGYQNTTNTGLPGSYKLGARYYDTHAHFTQPDPANPVGASTYLYAGADPINAADPSGLYPGESLVNGAVAGAKAVLTSEAFRVATAAYACYTSFPVGAQLGFFAGIYFGPEGPPIGLVVGGAAACVIGGTAAYFGYNPIQNGL